MAYDCCSYVIKNEKQNRNIKNSASLFVYQRKMQKIEWQFSATIDQSSICYNTVATKVEVTVKMFLFFNMHLPLYAWNSHQTASLFQLRHCSLKSRFTCYKNQFIHQDITSLTDFTRLQAVPFLWLSSS